MKMSMTGPAALRWPAWLPPTDPAATLSVLRPGATMIALSVWTAAGG